VAVFTPHPPKTFALIRQPFFHIPALLNSGGLLLAARQISLASAAYSRVLKQQPGNSSALFGLGQCREISGEQEAALATYTHSLSLQPDDLSMLTMVESLRLGLTLWDDYDARMQQLGNQLEHNLDAGEPISMAVPLRLLSFPLPLALTRRVAACHAKAITAAMASFGQMHPRQTAKIPASPTQQPNPASGRRPLRIGYLSADFRSHPMGGLIHGLFAEHDRSAAGPWATCSPPTAIASPNRWPRAANSCAMSASSAARPSPSRSRPMASMCWWT
jgi:hypothetical protein